MPDLPSDIVALAYRSSGEFAWRRKDVGRAIEAIRLSGQAILGWEVWIVQGRRWTGRVPSVTLEPAGVWSFDTTPRKLNESWTQYCQRTATEATLQIAGARVEEESTANVRDAIHFNLTFVEEGACGV